MPVEYARSALRIYFNIVIIKRFIFTDVGKKYLNFHIPQHIMWKNIIFK